MATSTSNELVIEKADSATLILHPLVLINIADHVTRQRVFTKTPNPRVVGALLGQQRAKTIELLHSFELIYATAADGSISLDVEFFRERKGQCTSSPPLNHSLPIARSLTHCQREQTSKPLRTTMSSAGTRPAFR